MLSMTDKQAPSRLSVLHELDNLRFSLEILEIRIRRDASAGACFVDQIGTLEEYGNRLIKLARELYPETPESDRLNEYVEIE